MKSKKVTDVMGPTEVGKLRKFLRDAGVDASVAAELVLVRGRGLNMLDIQDWLNAEATADGRRSTGDGQ